MLKHRTSRKAHKNRKYGTISNAFPRFSRNYMFLKTVNSLHISKH